MRNAEVDRLEHVVGRILRTGSWTSTAILAAGVVLTLAAPSFGPAHAIIRIGLLVLLLTPVARVVASVVEYANDRDWLFTLLTSLVLVIVVASLIVGLLER